MKISKFNFHPYTLNLITPFKTTKGTISERKGFIISINGESGFKTLGDSAPLPEYGTETLENIQNLLPQLSLVNKEFGSVNEIENFLNEFNDSPALKHGLDQALISLYSLESNKNLYELFDCKSINKIINVNSVIGSSTTEDIINQVKMQFSMGYTTFKLKLGTKEIPDEIHLLQQLRKIFDKKISLRIDINGAWCLDEAVENIKHLEEFNIEYIEQPCSTLEELKILADKSDLPIAADESIRSFDEAVEVLNNTSINVLILKPMMLGGIIATMKIINEAAQKGMKTVISSSFESTIGRKALVFLASLVKNNTAHGLGTDKYFATGYGNNPFPVKEGKIHINNLTDLISTK